MKIRYLPDTDTLYISDDLIVDFDEGGKPVGVTLEHYSQISDSRTIETQLPITPVFQPA
jgi:uncharacterized protein YuzE